jgi:hypothetical protein
VGSLLFLFDDKSERFTVISNRRLARDEAPRAFQWMKV